jgi:hypothetical protein
MSVAPSCPISHGQPIPGARVLLHGDPWHRIHDAVEQIPWANDLRSAIAALNMMARIITDILRTGPQINNIKSETPPDQIEKGQNNDPRYQRADWIQENRVYDKRKLVNPDDSGQFIEIKVLTQVTFFNQNTTYRLQYGV